MVFALECSILEFPLAIPRRLPIPLLEEETWSKPYAVAGVSFSPFLLAFIRNTQDDLSSLSRKLVYLLGAVVSFTLGTLGYMYTRSESSTSLVLISVGIRWVSNEYHLVLHDCKRACCVISRIWPCF